MPSGRNLLVTLRDGDGQGSNGLYLRLGALPTRGAYDSRGSAPGSANQDVLIPAAPRGIWYVLVHGESVPGNGEFTIEAVTSPLVINQPERQFGAVGSLLTMTLTGGRVPAGHDRQTAVSSRRPRILSERDERRLVYQSVGRVRPLRGSGR